MKRVVLGLGNPGVEYAQTRHNAGMVLVDAAASMHNAQCTVHNYGWRRKTDIFVFECPHLTLVKTASVFMNESGRIVYELRAMNYELENLWVAHDDLDIKLGEYKVQRGRGPREHNGLLSVEEAIGTKDFWRIRIGIENRDQETENRVSGEDYVLQKFSEGEKKILNEVLEAIIGEAEFKSRQ